jgi:hypothetical protein
MASKKEEQKSLQILQAETKQLEILNATMLKILAKLDKLQENQEAMIELLAIDLDESDEEGSEDECEDEKKSNKSADD